MQHFFRRIDGSKNVEVFDGDHFLAHQRVADPVEEAFPVLLADQDHRKRFDLLRLNQRNCFEEFVQRAETARQNNERDGVLDEHYFSDKKVTKVEELVRVDVGFLFQGQL